MKKKKSSIGTAIIAILLCFIVIGAISAFAPWLPLVVVIVAIGFAVSKNKGTANGGESRKKPATTNPPPFSASVNNDIRIMQDCVTILNTSENLQTVIHRYNDLLIILERLCEYEKNPAVSFPHELPSAVLRRIESEKPQIMNRAIQRAYDGMLRKCASLKTEKGRKNRQLKFFDELNDLMPDFPEETRNYAVNFINQNINDPLTGLEGL